MSMSSIQAQPDVAGDGLPTVLCSLLDGAVASFDADRDASRRYLLRASALLRTLPSAPRRGQERGGLALWQLNRVIDYLDTHVAERIRAETLAGLINVSIGHLFRAFRVSVGVPPFEYLARQRIASACTMMRATSAPLSQIAVACGLADQPHFCRVFRRVVGTSPAAWRRANASAPQS
jgi:transcriptional regulator GlxA family with amidase domain